MRPLLVTLSLALTVRNPMGAFGLGVIVALMGVGLALVKWPLLPDAHTMPLYEGVTLCLLTAMSLLALVGASGLVLATSVRWLAAKPFFDLRSVRLFRWCASSQIRSISIAMPWPAPRHMERMA